MNSQGIPLEVILSIQDGEFKKYMNPTETKETVQLGALTVVGCLPRGMKSGLPSFEALIELPDGTHIIGETSWRNMSLAAIALIGKWGTP